MIVETRIESLGFLGDGVAQIEGRKIHVPYCIDGEKVRIDVMTGSDDHAELIEVLEPSEHRRTAPCPYFTKCGGCKLQHLEPDYYMEFKKSLEPEAASISPTAERLRRRATFSYDGKNLGFNAYKSHEIIGIDSCLLLKNSLNELIPHLKTLAPKIGAKSSFALSSVNNGITLEINKEKIKNTPDTFKMLSRFAYDSGIIEISLNGEQVLMLAPPKITFSGIEVAFKPGDFLQPSKDGEDALTRFVLAALEKKKKYKVADLFCGLGTFAYAARQAGHKVQGFDIAAQHPFIKKNLFSAPLTHKELQEFDAVIFDPPRAGASKQVENIVKAKVPVVIAVSCNPATFGRDRKILETGGYKLKALNLVDQFLYSNHLELVAVFS